MSRLMDNEILIHCNHKIKPAHGNIVCFVVRMEYLLGDCVELEFGETMLARALACFDLFASINGDDESSMRPCDGVDIDVAGEP